MASDSRDPRRNFHFKFGGKFSDWRMVGELVMFIYLIRFSFEGRKFSLVEFLWPLRFDENRGFSIDSSIQCFDPPGLVERRNDRGKR